jgi:hypothetical protein
VDRKKIIAELSLRNFIRNIVESFDKEHSIAEDTIRKIIQKQIITEKQSNAEMTLHPSTGINVLEELLKKIVPQLEQDFKSLTSTKEQRGSFRAHIINAVSKSLTAADINKNAGSGEDVALATPQIAQEEVSVDVNPTDSDKNDTNLASDSDASKFINIKGNKKSKELQKNKDFTIPGQNETGRNMAMMSYDKIEKNILDSYSILSDNEDQKVFYDYLLTNLKLYFDKFESEISTSVKEPDVDTTNDAEQNFGDVGGSEVDKTTKSL